MYNSSTFIARMLDNLIPNKSWVSAKHFSQPLKTLATYGIPANLLEKFYQN